MGDKLAIYHLRPNQQVVITVGEERDGYQLVNEDRQVKEDGARGIRYQRLFTVEDGKVEIEKLGGHGYKIVRGVDIK